MVIDARTTHKANTATKALTWPHPCADPEGGRVAGPPLENKKNIGFLSNTGPDPLKITKLPIQHSISDHHRPASETPFKWRFAGGPIKDP